MKKALLIISIIGLTMNANAQKLELSLQANAGMFRFAGTSATDVSYVNYSQNPGESYTNNPYGNKYAFSYGLGIKAGLVDKHDFMLGATFGYDELKSKVALIDAPAPTLAVYTATYGHTYFVNHFINIGPYIGYRFKIKNWSVDALPGLDIALGLNSHEDGSYNNKGVAYQITRKRETPPTDVRVRMGAAVNYSRFSFNASFAKASPTTCKSILGAGLTKLKASCSGLD